MDEIQQDTTEVSLRKVILVLVNANQGLKAVELVCKVMGVINPLMFREMDYNSELEKLVKEGELVQIEYVLPQLNYRVKTIYFPKGTVIHGENVFGSNAKTSGIPE